MSKVWITGSSGFVGHHLIKVLAGHEIFHYNLRDGNDLRDYERLRNSLDVIRPDYIYHLAAQAYVPESIANPKRTFETNAIGSINLLEAVRQLGLKPKILLAGTSEEYGSAHEGQELHPMSPYAISKAAMDQMGQLYAHSYGLHIVVTRAFNHSGPGRGEMYADSAWAKQIAEIEKGHRTVLEHGNLESIRNYSDVRDIVKAYTMAIDLPPDVYNICSDQNVKMGAILTILLGLTKKPIKRKQMSALMRSSDFSFRPPNCNKFKQLTGWEPELTLQDNTLPDLLNYWRKQV